MAPAHISRREFIKLAAMAGLLAGCRPTRRVVVSAELGLGTNDPDYIELAEVTLG